MNPVRFLNPTFPPAGEIAADYAAIVERGVFSNGGPVERELLTAVQNWVGGDVTACTVSSCTAGIELAVRATFHPDRQLAIVPSFTFAAGPLVLRSCGYTPVFVDIDPADWQPQLTDAEKLLAEHDGKVAGILLTATFGVANPEIAAWEKLARQHSVPLVLDSAAGFGAMHRDGQPMGAHGTCEVFSMHATKTLAAGEGGLITSRDSDLIERLHAMKNFGFDKDRQCVVLGTNAKLPELTSAIALRQLANLPERLRLRREVVARYEAALQPLGVRFQPGVERSAPAFVSTVLPTPDTRDAVASALQSGGVECRDYYNPPVHAQPFFAGSLQCGELAATANLASRVLSLPMADQLGADVILGIAGLIEQALSG